MMSLKSLLSVATVAITLTLAGPAFADSISFTLLNPTQTIAPGQIATFSATVSATPGNGANVYLNSDAANVADANSAFMIDDGDFGSFPLFLTPDGLMSTYTGALFTVTNTGAVDEAYMGSFTIFGGADSNDTTTPLGTVTFGSPVAMTVTPEPSSLVLLGTGLVGLVAAGKRRLSA